jgi:hypothetical protein
MRFRINVSQEYGGGFFIGCRKCTSHLLNKNALPGRSVSAAYSEMNLPGPLMLAQTEDIKPMPNSTERCDGCGAGKRVEHMWDASRCLRCRGFRHTAGASHPMHPGKVLYSADGERGWAVDEPACIAPR